jgi:hypothetical protein
MAQQDFIQQLQAMGFQPEDRGNGCVVFDYTIETGVRFLGQTIKLGFEVPADFPLQAPTGPHISPRILPLNDSGEHPNGKILVRPLFGDAGEYWSRPFPEWPNTDRTVAAYMRHIHKLFSQ